MSYLSLLTCRMFSVGCMHFSACVVYDTNFPTQGAIWTLSLRERGLVELDDFGVAHIGDQVLRLFTEMVDLFRCLKVFQEHIPAWVIFKLFNMELQGVENQHDYCHKSPCAHELRSHDHRIFSNL